LPEIDHVPAPNDAANGPTVCTLPASEIVTATDTASENDPEAPTAEFYSRMTGAVTPVTDSVGSAVSFAAVNESCAVFPWLSVATPVTALFPYTTLFRSLPEIDHVPAPNDAANGPTVCTLPASEIVTATDTASEN